MPVAIYHFSMQVISRGKGQSVVASAAYRSGEKLFNERYDKVSHYQNREVKPETFILKPSHAPAWCLERVRLWNEVEHIEKAKNAQLAREFNVALPIELTNEEQRALLVNFVDKTFVAEGMVADVAIHRDDPQNPHAHVLLTIRPFNEDGSWGAKAKKEYLLDDEGNFTYTKSGAKRSRKITTTNWDDKETLARWRSAWAFYANQHLRLAGHSVTISEKSNEALGKVEEPSIHEGFTARKLAKQGEFSDRVAINEEIKARNKAHVKLDEVNQRLERITKHERRFTALTPAERTELKQLAKVLRMYIAVDTLEDKKKILARWRSKLDVQEEFETVEPKVWASLQQQEQAHKQATALLTNEAKRIMTTHYGNSLNSDYLNRMVVSEMSRLGRPLNEQELRTFCEAHREEELVEELEKITQQPLITATTARERLTELQRDPLANAEEKKLLALALKLFDDYYDEQLEKVLPSFNKKRTPLQEKEWLVAAIHYYGKPMLSELLTTKSAVPLTKYSPAELQLVKGYLQSERTYFLAQQRGSNDGAEEVFAFTQKMPERLVKDVQHPRYQSFVLSECLAHGILTTDEVMTLASALRAHNEQGETVYFNESYGGKLYPMAPPTQLLNQLLRGQNLTQILSDLEQQEKIKQQLQKQIKRKK